MNARTERLAEKITGSLRTLGHGSRQGHRPSAQGDFGVATPDLRRVVREYAGCIREADGDDVFRLGLALLDRNNTECRQVAYELIASHRAARESLNVRRIEALGRGIDNWCCVDNFCCTLAGGAWREGRLTDAAILRWSRSRDVWWRRAAVVATVPLNLRSRGGTGDTGRTLMVCEALVADSEEMVQKAISWALRSLVFWDRDAVAGFLADHADEVSARVRREVNRKLTTGRKN